MQKITWKCVCAVCGRLIHSGRPTLLFATDRPELVGVSHSTHIYSKSRYGHFQMCPPHRLSNEQVSFLAPFFHKLYALPGGLEPNGQLRICFVHLLWDYPASLANPLVAFNESVREQSRFPRVRPYHGDLEGDYLRLLGAVQVAARQKPLDVEIDFRQTSR